MKWKWFYKKIVKVTVIVRLLVQTQMLFIYLIVLGQVMLIQLNGLRTMLVCQMKNGMR